MINGFIFLDKPINKLSHETTSLVARMLKTKAGHAGTLDPNVSGVLPIGIGRARKFLRFLANENKTYVGIIKFPEPKNYDEINELFHKFTGIIEQIPPKISAVAKKKRKRRVYELKILEIKGSRVLFKAKVEKGTYIRTLCKDMGGYMEDLRRIQVGTITENMCITLNEVRNRILCKDLSFIRSIHNVFWNKKKIFLKKTAAHAFLSGAQIMRPGIKHYEEFNKNEIIALYYNHTFLGFGETLVNSKELEQMQKGKIVKTIRVYKTDITE